MKGSSRKKCWRNCAFKFRATLGEAVFSKKNEVPPSFLGSAPLSLPPSLSLSLSLSPSLGRSLIHLLESCMSFSRSFCRRRLPNERGLPSFSPFPPYSPSPSLLCRKVVEDGADEGRRGREGKRRASDKTSEERKRDCEESSLPLPASHKLILIIGIWDSDRMKTRIREQALQ